MLLPPTLKNTEKNNLLSNTRSAIREATMKNEIKTMDTRVSLGYQYSEFNNGVKVRTTDGIHITKNGNLKKTGSDLLRYDLKTALSDLFRSCKQYQNLQLGIVIEENPVNTEQKKLREK